MKVAQIRKALVALFVGLAGAGAAFGFYPELLTVENATAAAGFVATLVGLVYGVPNEPDDDKPTPRLKNNRNVVPVLLAICLLTVALAACNTSFGRYAESIHQTTKPVTCAVAKAEYARYRARPDADISIVRAMAAGVAAICA